MDILHTVLYKYSKSTDKENLTFNPLHPNINMHVLHNFLFTFLEVLTNRISSKIERVFS